MKIDSASFHLYDLPLTTGVVRKGILLEIKAEGKTGWGDIAPLPGWSKESLDDALEQLLEKRNDLLSGSLLPSVAFGVESALLSITDPVSEDDVEMSALFMGTVDQILEHAKDRVERSAKLKVSQLSFDDAFTVIHLLKDRFHLRIDVNRAWETEDSLRFFSQFEKDVFDYVEEPFKDPNDLKYFTHPLAVDESIQMMDSIPNLKAVVYKPTVRGGMAGCKEVKKRGVELVLSSSFESDVGLIQIARMAKRLGLRAPVGIGTYWYLGKYFCERNDRLFRAGH
jgi:O-succinylbenzoate synthase